MASINTNNVDRDNHIRSDDFFGVEQYPTMTYPRPVSGPRATTSWWTATSPCTA